MVGIALGIGLLAFVAFLLVIKALTGSNKAAITRKVRRYAGKLDQTIYEKRQPKTQIRYAEEGLRLLRYLGTRLRGLPQSKGLEIKMQQAGWPLLGSEFLALLGLVVAAGGIFAMMLTMRFTYACLGAFFAGAGLLLYLRRTISCRKNEFSSQLGDALGMMSNSMRAGFSFMQSLKLVSKELAPPVSVEFAKTFAEIQMGASVETALLNMGRRVQSPDLNLVITAVLIQKQVGGNLAQIFDKIEATIAERIKMKQEIKTLTAQGRLSGWVLAALPFVVAGAMSIVSPDYLKPLWEEPLGHILIGGGVVSECIGFFFIRRIVTLDV